jgi:N6-L-threonylcarbamoyladenine synthase
MLNQNLKILAIETSCDETAAAVICVCHPEQSEGSICGSRIKCGTTGGDHPVVLSNVVSSQINLHAKTGGVVPEVASRAHMECIIPVVIEALEEAGFQKNPNFKIQIPNEIQISKSKYSNEASQANPANEACDLSQITHIAITAGPGLIGSLLVGFNTAKAMAYALDLPIVPINHIEGHIYSAIGGEIRNPKSEILNNFVLRNSCFEFPILALTVSGGHTSLTLMRDHGVYETIGQTRDDAAGEAFDKVAKLLGLGYPGGPVVSRLAEEYRRQNPNYKAQISNKIQSSNFKKTNRLTTNNYQLVLPRPMIKDKSFDFSFSGLKTAVLDVVKNLGTEELKNRREEICVAFEDAAVDVLVTKTLRAAEKYKPKAVILAGGVAANKRLREELSNQLKTKDYQLILPPAELCGDNAAMIGLAAYYHIVRGDTKKWNQIKIDSNLKI